MLHIHMLHSLQILAKEALTHNLNCIEIFFTSEGPLS